jgi:hypothetical protein
MMAPYCPLVALVSVFLFDAARRPRWAAALLVLLFSQNYVSQGPSGDTVAPSSRIFQSPARLQRKVSYLHARGRHIYAARGDRKLLAGPKWDVPCIVYELLCEADDFEWVRARDGDSVLSLTGTDGRVQSIRTAAPPGENVKTMEDKGWTVLSWPPAG